MDLGSQALFMSLSWQRIIIVSLDRKVAFVCGPAIVDLHHCHRTSEGTFPVSGSTSFAVIEVHISASREHHQRIFQKVCGHCKQLFLTLYANGSATYCITCCVKSSSRRIQVMKNNIVVSVRFACLQANNWLFVIDRSLTHCLADCMADQLVRWLIE